MHISLIKGQGVQQNFFQACAARIFRVDLEACNIF